MNLEDLVTVVREILGVSPLAQGNEGHVNGNTAPWVLAWGPALGRMPGEGPGYRAFSVAPLASVWMRDTFATSPSLAFYGSPFGIPRGWAVLMTVVPPNGDDAAILAAREWASVCAGASER